MWVNAMTHSSDAVKSFIQNHILSNFCVGVVITFKNSYSTEFKIKFVIDWYVYCPIL